MPLPPAPPADVLFLPADTFANDVVFITGAGTGIGKGLAETFARHGARVAVASRGKEHREAGVKAVAAVGGRAAGIEVNVRSAESIKAAFDRTEAELGPVSIVVNNAAANFPAVSEKLSPKGWAAITQSVLDGTFFCCTEFARRRIAAGLPGAILNIGATYGWTGGPGAAPSAAAKAGVMNLTQSLAVEWAPDGIRVNGIAPGVFPHRDFPPAMLALQMPDEDAGKRIPAGRVGRMHEIGRAACFLCSPFASYITGHNLVVDGGNWLRRTLWMPEFQPVREWADSRNLR